MQASIAKTGFLVSLTSYVCFWLLDALRPGFVARYVSVHVFLLSSLLFGVWWVRLAETPIDHPRLHVVLALLLGILCLILVWRLGGGFGSLRILVSLLSFFIPLVVLRLVKYK